MDLIIISVIVVVLIGTSAFLPILDSLQSFFEEKKVKREFPKLVERSLDRTRNLPKEERISILIKETQDFNEGIRKLNKVRYISIKFMDEDIERNIDII